MPPKKTYTHAGAIEKARDAFWENGYERLGVRALGVMAGVNRFALQTEFGGKQGLFLEVLDKYARDSREAIIGPIESGGLDALSQFFKNLTTQQPDDMRDYGCLMVNTVIENAGLADSAIKEKTDAHYNGVQASFKKALENAQENGEVSDDFDVEASVSYLLALAMGVQVYVRMKGQVAAAEALGVVAQNVIASWRMQDA